MSTKLVEEGYEKIAHTYSSARDQLANISYLEKFTRFIRKGSTILDIGCGAGKPVDKYLVKHGFAVNGIDISTKMIELAKKNVPHALYEVRDMLTLHKDEYCVNGIVSFYAIFHTPREKHQKLLTIFKSFMPHGGAILITMGAVDWEGTEENFHDTKMFWSHYGAEKNSEMVKKAGFSIILNEIDNSGEEKHQVILATC